jgi:hypothetical protein
VPGGRLKPTVVTASTISVRVWGRGLEISRRQHRGGWGRRGTGGGGWCDGTAGLSP